MLGLQGRLSTALAELHAAQQKASVLDNKVATLEAELKLAAATEQRLTAEVSQVGHSPGKPLITGIAGFEPQVCHL